MKPNENPPIGLILCAEKGASEARYALGIYRAITTLAPIIYNNRGMLFRGKGRHISMRELFA